MIKGLSAILAISLLSFTWWLQPSKQRPKQPPTQPHTTPELAPLVPNEVPVEQIPQLRSTPADIEADPLYQQLRSMYQDNLHSSPSEMLKQLQNQATNPSFNTNQEVPVGDPSNNWSSRSDGTVHDEMSEEEWLAMEYILKGARLLAKGTAPSPQDHSMELSLANPEVNRARQLARRQLAKQLRAQVAAYLEQ